MTSPKQLGKYQIEARVGEGAMGVVYRAFDPDLQQAVAIKVIRKGLVEGCGGDLVRLRFKNEAIAGRRLRHKNIVPVYDYGEDHDCSFIVMDWVEGRHLKDVLKSGHRFTLSEVLSVMEQLLEALDYAHSRNVVHRDIKPSNLLYSEAGQIQVVDFGIARIESSTLTIDGAILGTPSYMAPEQCQGTRSDHRADIFAAGVILYELLTGERAFRASTGIAVLQQVLSLEPIKPSQLNAQIPPALDAIVARAMGKRREERYQSARELSAALKQFAHAALSPIAREASIPTVPGTVVDAAARGKTTKRKGVLVTAGSVALVALAIILGFHNGTCSQIPPTVEKNRGNGTLSFGTLFPKTGRLNYRLPQLDAGWQLARKDIIDSGGIAGINLSFDEAHRLNEGDDASIDLACQSADALLAADIDVIIGPALSVVTEKVIDKVIGAGVILFSPANTATVFSTYDDHQLYFRTAASNVFQGSVLGKLVVRDGNQSAVVMSVNDVYGNSLREETAKAIEEAGGQVIDSFSYDPFMQNFDHEVQRVISANPHAVVLVGYLRDSANILRTMITRGVGPKDKNLYGAANVSPTLVRQVNPQDLSALTGMKGTSAAVKNEEFSSRLKQLDPSLQDVTYAAESYDAVVITALAADIADTDAPGEIAKRINDVTRGGEKCTSFAACKKLVGEGKNIDYDGASGPLEFTDAGEPSSTSYVIHEIQADGSLKSIRIVKVVKGRS